MRQLRVLMALVIAGLFFSIAGVLVALSGYQFVAGIVAGTEIATALLKTVSTAVVALATFELAIGITREYRADAADGNIFANVRRTATRFISVVCIALILEALIMVIKYSQLELAGNLPYPVAIIAGASVLLVALGVFLNLTRADSEKPARRLESAPFREAASSRLYRCGLTGGSEARPYIVRSKV